jgi:hypothetical protein
MHCPDPLSGEAVTTPYQPKRGSDLLHDPVLNKGTAFSDAERDAFGLRGLLPPRVMSQDEQLARILPGVRSKPSPLEQYAYLVALHARRADAGAVHAHGRSGVRGVRSHFPPQSRYVHFGR